MLSGNVIRGLKATLVSRVISVVARGGLILVLTRYLLDTREYGLLFFAISVFGVAQLFASLGLAKSGAKFISQYSEKDPTQIPHILSTVLKYRMIMAVVVGTPFLFLGGWLAELLNEPAVGPLLRLGVGYLFAQSVLKYTTLTFQGLNRVFWSAVIGIVSSVGQLVFVAGFVFLDFGIRGAMIGYIVNYAVAAAFGLTIIYTKFYREYDRADTMESGLRRRIRRYSIPLTATKGANVLDKRIDTILLGVLANPVAVGYYTLGKQVTDFVIAPASSLGFSIAPTYGQKKESDDLSHAARVYESTFEYILLLYIPAAVGLALVAEPMIRYVFNTDYLGAVPVVQIFSIFIIFQAIDKITNDALDFLGRSTARAYSKGLSAAANFVLNLLLIPLYGVVGASVATVLTYGLMVAVNLYIMRQELPIKPAYLAKRGVKIMGVSAAMGVVVLFALPYITSLVTLFGAIAVGVAIWSVLSILIGILDIEEIRTVLT